MTKSQKKAVKPIYSSLNQCVAILDTSVGVGDLTTAWNQSLAYSCVSDLWFSAAVIRSAPGFGSVTSHQVITVRPLCRLRIRNVQASR